MNLIESCGLLILVSGAIVFVLSIPNIGYMSVAFIIIVIGIAIFGLGTKQ
jgi:hypothetical protein